LTGEIKASVIIPVKNGGNLFKRVLEAVLAQETDWPFELIVIDSGSRDGSLEYARQCEGLRLIEIPAAEFGHGRTRNRGARESRGEFVVFITHDALPASRTWLANLVAAAELAPDVAGVFGRHLAYPEARPATRRELEVHFRGFGESVTLFRMEDKARYATDVVYRQYLHFFSDNNALLRKSVWEQMPYPDVDFAEDQAWAKAIIEAGYAKAYAPDAAVFHSHDFGIVETFQRSYDEARALNALFGYQQVTSVRQGIRSWLYLTRRNAGWSRDPAQGVLAFMGHAAAVPLLAAAKLIGLYMGERSGSMPAWAVAYASRDQRLRNVGASAEGQEKQ